MVIFFGLIQIIIRQILTLALKIQVNVLKNKNCTSNSIPAVVCVWKFRTFTCNTNILLDIVYTTNSLMKLTLSLSLLFSKVMFQKLTPLPLIFEPLVLNSTKPKHQFFHSSTMNIITIQVKLTMLFMSQKK
jgi:hypothetical protein